MKPLAEGYIMLATVQWASGGVETYSKLLGSILDLLDLNFREAFDTKESF
jgi:hypothetical protein